MTTYSNILLKGQGILSHLHKVSDIAQPLQRDNIGNITRTHSTKYLQALLQLRDLEELHKLITSTDYNKYTVDKVDHEVDAMASYLYTNKDDITLADTIADFVVTFPQYTSLFEG